MIKNDEPEFSSELPTEEEIHEGRKTSLIIGIVVGALVVALGVVFYFMFGR